MTWKTTAEPRKLSPFPGTCAIEETEAPPFHFEDGNIAAQHFVIGHDGTVTPLPDGVCAGSKDRVIRIDPGDASGDPEP